MATSSGDRSSTPLAEASGELCGSLRKQWAMVVWAAGGGWRSGAARGSTRSHARAVVPEHAVLEAILLGVTVERLQHKGEAAQLQATLVGMLSVQLPADRAPE